MKVHKLESLYCAFIIVVIGCTSSGQAPEQNEKVVTISQKQAQEMDQEHADKQIPEFFVFCHPRYSDLSPDGKVFVTLTPDAPLLNFVNFEDIKNRLVRRNCG